jgi:hypothetical protein
MTYRPRQVVVRARETVAEMLRALERERLVIGFLDAYAKEYSRPGRTAHPARVTELLATIGREALLAMVARMDATLAQHPSFRVKARLRPAEAKARANLRDLFREEFFVSLGQALDWEDDDLESFLHDLGLYEHLAVQVLDLQKPRKLSAGLAGPFVDRVGLLLDPAMLEKARRAAGKFQSQLNATVDRILRTVFSLRRKN